MGEKTEEKISITLASYLLSIDFCGTIDLAKWSEKMGEIQSRIMSMNSGEIDVQFGNCKSCPPIAIAALLFSVIRKKDYSEIDVSLYLSSESGITGTCNPVVELFSEMCIFQLCAEYKIKVYIDGEEVHTADTVDISRVSAEAYPLYILSDDDHDQIKEFIDKAYGDMLAASQNDTVISCVKNILYETIHNVYEHAYPDGTKHYAAVLLIKRNDTYKDLYGKRLDDYFVLPNTYYEIIVLDEGIGLTESLTIKNAKGKEAKHPLETSIRQTFISPSNQGETKGRKNKSYYKGLEFVYKLLSEKGDYVFIREQEEMVPLRGRSSNSLIADRYSSKYQGLSLMFGVTINRDNNYDQISKVSPFSNGVNKLLLDECKKRYELIEKRPFEYLIEDDRDLFKLSENQFVDICTDNALRGLIWLNNQPISKNDIFNRIYSFSDNKSVRYLLIGDVITSELPTYYCAIENMHHNNEVQFEKIIIVTRALRVQIFTKNQYTYNYNENETEKYLASFGEDLFASLAGYYQFITYYDSSIFWSKLLKKNNKKHLLVRGDIRWGDNDSLEYYLNLELILCNRELYEIIKHFLYRVSGFLENECIYKNTDILMKKICIDLNYGTKETDTSSKVYVESVYVTGKTDAVVDISERDLKVSLFVNYYNNQNEINDVNSIILWPTKDFLDENIQKWEGILHRKNDSYSLELDESSDRRNIDLIRSNNDIYERDSDSTQRDILDLFGGFMMVGHFEYHNNHDIFAINQREIIKISHYEKNGAFVYALQHLMNSVGKNYIDDLNREWRDSDRIDLSCCCDGVMVYRMHYYTNYLFENLSTCFKSMDCKIWDYVIPIESMKKKKNNSPLMISDLYLDNLRKAIEEKYKKNNKITITLFDTMSVSGKTFSDMYEIIKEALPEEIKQAGSNCTINEVVLFNCDPYPLFRTNINKRAYYLFNLPRLGTNDYCPLCSLLSDIQESKKLLNSDIAKKQMNSWINTWGANSPLLDHGINVRKLRVKKENFLLSIMKSIETAYSNNDENYLFRYYQDNLDYLNIEEKLLILSFQILLFPQKDSYRNYNNAYTELFSQLAQAETTGEATALAAMICINANSKTASNAIKSIKEIKNEDIRIVVAIMYARNKKLEETSLFSEVEDILKIENRTDIDLIKQFHSLLYNDYGIDHKTRLVRLQSEHATSEELSRDCALAGYSLERLETIIHKLNPLLIRSDGSVSKNYPQTAEKDKALDAIGKGKELIRDVANEIAYTDKMTKLKKGDIDILKNDVIAPLEMFHRKLFIAYGNHPKNDQPNRIGQEIENSINAIIRNAANDSDLNRPSNEKAPDSESSNVYLYYDPKKKRTLKIMLETRVQDLPSLSGSVKELWYLWTENVIEEIQYLFADVRHCTDRHVEQKTFNDLNMVATFSANNEGLVLKLRTTSENSSEEIKNSLSQKHRYQRESLEKYYNVRIRYDSCANSQGGYDLMTTVEIPAV